MVQNVKCYDNVKREKGFPVDVDRSWFETKLGHVFHMDHSIKGLRALGTLITISLIHKSLKPVIHWNKAKIIKSVRLCISAMKEDEFL